MNHLKYTVAPVLLTGVWVNFSEFTRNELLLKSYWVEHYEQLGMTFPSDPINGAAWMVWGFMFATVIFIISRKFNLVQTALLSWFVAFVLMWIVVWNMRVLPGEILYFAIPLSLLESFIGAYICKKASR